MPWTPQALNLIDFLSIKISQLKEGENIKFLKRAFAKAKY